MFNGDKRPFKLQFSKGQSSIKRIGVFEFCVSKAEVSHFGSAFIHYTVNDAEFEQGEKETGELQEKSLDAPVIEEKNN
jgi:hypothetical protein